MSNPAKWPQYVLLALLLAVSGAVPRIACADNGVQSATGAEQSVRLGQEALQRRDYVSARTHFEAAYRNEPRPQFLYSLGAVAQAEGALMEAADLYRRYLDAVGFDEAGVKAAAIVSVIDAQRERGSEVTVIGESGAFIRVDKKLVGVLPLRLPLLLAPGEHAITLELSASVEPAIVNLPPRRVAIVQFVRLNSGKYSPLVQVSPAVLLIARTTGEPGGVDEMVRQSLTTALRQEGALLIPADTLRAIERRFPKLASCEGQIACIDQVTRKAGAQYALSVGIHQMGDGFATALRLLDGTTGESAPESTERCEKCSLQQVLNRLAALAQSAIRNAIDRPLGALAISSTPMDAALSIDGRPSGQTPYQRPASVGSHMVSVSRAGFLSEERKVDVREGEQTELFVRLEVDKTVAERKARRLRTGLQWSLLAIGLAGMATGAILWALDGYQNCDVAASGMCPFALDSRNAGISLLGAGAAVTTAAIVLIGLDYRKRRSR